MPFSTLPAELMYSVYAMLEQREDKDALLLCSKDVYRAILPQCTRLTVNMNSWSIFPNLKNHLHALPSSLRELSCKGYDGYALPNSLPPTLRSLDCSFSKRLLFLPPLPSTLRVLICVKCKSLRAFPPLPSSVQVVQTS